MKKYILIILSVYALASDISNYQITLYNIPMANVKIEYIDTMLNKTKAIELKRFEYLDVDTEEDLKVLKKIYKYKLHKN